MSQEISLKKNYLFSVGYQLLILITPFITAPYVSRVLGADGVGIYSYSMSVVTYFTLFAALGTASYGSIAIAQKRDDKRAYSKTFWEIELMTVITSSICLAVWIGVIIFSKDYRYYFLALMPLIISTMVDISWFFTGLEQMKYIFVRNSVAKIAGIVLLFILVRDKDDVVIYMIINTGINLIGNLSMWTYLPKFVEKIPVKTLQMKAHFKETLIYFVPTIATSIYTVLDKTLIGVITHSEFENGYYEQATKLVNIVKALVFTSVNTVMSPRMAYLYVEKRFDEVRSRIKKSMNFILMMGFGCTFGLVGVAKVFVPLFFGAGYEPVITLIYVMAPIIIIIGISNCMGSQYFTPSGQRARSAKYIIFGSCVNLVLNLILIPRLSSHGAAIGSILAELAITVLYVKMSDGYMTVSILFQAAWKRVIAGAIMCVIIFAAGSLIPAPAIVVFAIQVVLGIALYFGLLKVMKDNMLGELIGMVMGKLKRK